MEKGKS
jgi:hypothetical protein